MQNKRSIVKNKHTEEKQMSFASNKLNLYHILHISFMNKEHEQEEWLVLTYIEYGQQLYWLCGHSVIIV